MPLGKSFNLNMAKDPCLKDEDTMQIALNIGCGKERDLRKENFAQVLYFH